MELPCFVGF